MEIIEAVKLIDRTVYKDSKPALHSFLNYEFNDILDNFRAQYIVDLFDSSHEPEFQSDCIVQKMAVQAVEEAVERYGLVQMAPVKDEKEFFDALKNYSVNYILN